MESTATLVAIPVALAATGLEALWARKAGRDAYGAASTVSDLLQATGHLVVGAMLQLTAFVGYAAVQRHLPWQLDAASPLTWLVAFLAVDLQYYARHRALHRVGFLWAIHTVHHESNRYNLAVAQRIGWFTDFVVIPFVLPIALLGVPVEVVAPLFAFVQFYQFLLHTELVGKLPLVEGILMTPSAHRAHHACNKVYVDVNYGGVLAIWDRLFGSWVPEDEAPVFGTTSPIATWDPVDNNLRPFVQLAARAKASGSVGNALRVVFGPPRWQPGGEVAPAHPAPRTDPRGHVGWAAWAALCFVVAGGTALVFLGGRLDTPERWAAGLGLLVATWIIGALVDGADPIGAVRRAWAAIDAEASAGAGTGELAAVAAVGGLGVLVASRLANPAFVASVAPWLAADPSASAIGWALGAGVGFGLPALLYVAARCRPCDLGLGLGRLRDDVGIYFALFLINLPGLIVASGRPETAGLYPLSAGARDGLVPLLAWFVAYGAMFAGLEALFRGVLLFPLAKRFGSAAVTIGVVPYVFVHLLWDKGAVETAMSIPFGVLAATMALRSRSIWGVWALHFATAATMDLLVLGRDGTLARLVGGVS